MRAIPVKHEKLSGEGCFYFRSFVRLFPVLFVVLLKNERFSGQNLLFLSVFGLSMRGFPVNYDVFFKSRGGTKSNDLALNAVIIF